MSRPKGTAEFKALEREWYEKLRAEGFDDIENTDSPYRPLKSWHSYKFLNQHVSRRNAARTYFEGAEDILNHHVFDNADQKEVWMLHCHGVTEREIARRVPRYKKSMVHHIISQLSKRIKRE